MKIKTSKLEGEALDWAVATCENVECGENHEGIWFDDYDMPTPYTPSTDWSQGGPIIEREKITLDFLDGSWRGLILEGEQITSDGEGPTPLIAAMRCFVSYRLGNKVEIPEELK